MRRLESYIRKYGPELGEKMYRNLQQEAARASVHARLMKRLKNSRVLCLRESARRVGTAFPPAARGGRDQRRRPQARGVCREHGQGHYVRQGARRVMPTSRTSNPGFP
jgi:hypothetical protein